MYFLCNGFVIVLGLNHKMKKLSTFLFLILFIFSSPSFADQLSFDKKCKEVSYITEDGYKKYKVVCGKTLRCNGTTYTINLEDQFINISRGEDQWEINIVGDYVSGIFYYAIYQKNNEYYFDVITSNLDKQINRIYGEGNIRDFKEILRILKKIDRNISVFDKYVTVPSKRNRNDEIEKRKLDTILEFISTLKNKDEINQKCWSS